MNNNTTALEVLGYELGRIDHQLADAGADPNVMDWLETAGNLAAELDLTGRPLADIYPEIVQLCAVLMKAMNALPAPDEIADLVGYESLAGAG